MFEGVRDQSILMLLVITSSTYLSLYLSYTFSKILIDSRQVDWLTNILVVSPSGVASLVGV